MAWLLPNTTEHILTSFDSAGIPHLLSSLPQLCTSFPSLVLLCYIRAARITPKEDMFLMFLSLMPELRMSLI